MKTAKQYKQIEKEILREYEGCGESRIRLCDEDFKDGRLTVLGYDKLKTQCHYISMRKELEIVLPKNCKENFKNSLTPMAAEELARLKKESNYALLISTVCLIIGACLVLIRLVFSKEIIVSELTLIAISGFIWTAIDKFIFDRNKLQEQRMDIVQLLSAHTTSGE